MNDVIMNEQNTNSPIYKNLEPGEMPEVQIGGIKFDKEKLRWDALPYEVLHEVVKVMTFGLQKYSKDNWMKVENAHDRYFAAAMRHVIDEWWIKNSKKDEESGCHPLAHAICDLLFLLWFDLQEEKKNDNK